MRGERIDASAYHWALRGYAGLLIASGIVSEFAAGVCLGLAFGIVLDQFVLLPLARFLAARATRGARR